MSNHLSSRRPPEVEQSLLQDSVLYRDQLDLVEQQLTKDVEYELSTLPFNPDSDTPTIAVLSTENFGSDGTQLQVIDMRTAPLDEDGNKLYNGYIFTPDTVIALTCSFKQGETDKEGVVGVTEGTAFTFGRYKDGLDRTGQFPVDQTTSAKHFTIAATEDEKVTIRDTSTNGTKIFAKAEAVPAQQDGERAKGGRLRTAGKLAKMALHRFGDDRSDRDGMNRREVKAVARHEQERDDIRLAAAYAKVEAYVTQALHPGHTVMHNKIQGLEAVRDLAYTVMEKRPKEADRIADIVVRNRLDDKPIPALLGRWGQGDKELKQKRLLKMYDKDPVVAEELLARKVEGFHGTQSGALLSLIRHGGLLSAKEVMKRGENLATGERIYSPANGNGSISFADWRCAGTLDRYAKVPGESELSLTQIDLSIKLQQAEMDRYISAGFDPETHPFIYNRKSMIADMQYYADKIRRNPDSLESQLYIKNFPVAVGVKTEGIDVVETFFNKEEIAELRAAGKPYVVKRSISDIDGEFVIDADKVGFEHLPMIGVPKEHIPLVTKLLKDAGYSDTLVVDYDTLVA